MKKHYLLFFYILITLTSGFAVHGQSSVASAEQLVQYIGMKRNEAELKAWIQQLGRPNDRLSSGYTLTFPQKGLRLGFYRQKQLDKIMFFDAFRTRNGINFMAYPGVLPEGLQFGDSRAVVIQKVGRLPYRDHANVVEYNHLDANLLLFFEGTGLQAPLSKVMLRYKTCIRGDCYDGVGTYRDLAGNYYKGSWKDGKQHGNGYMRFADGTVKEGVWEKGNYRGPNFFKKHNLYDLLGKHHTSDAIENLQAVYPDTVREVQLSYDYFKQILDNGNIKLYFNDYGYLYKVDLKNNRIEHFARDLFERFSRSSTQRFVQYALGEPDFKKLRRGRDVWYYKKPPYMLRITFDRDKKVDDLEVKIADDSPLFDDLVGTCKSGDCQNGYGEAVSKAGRYVGNFEAGKFNGKGKYEFRKSDAIYIGHFRNNLRHGEGTYIWSNKSFYDGEWSKNQREGVGIMKYADGSKYIGNWKNNRRHGRGTMYYANEDRYEGQWKFGQPNGRGVIFYKNGGAKRGIWLNGHLRREY